MKEFSALRAKTYSYLTDNSNEEKMQNKHLNSKIIKTV